MEKYEYPQETTPRTPKLPRVVHVRGGVVIFDLTRALARGQSRIPPTIPTGSHKTTVSWLCERRIKSSSFLHEITSAAQQPVFFTRSAQPIHLSHASCLDLFLHEWGQQNGIRDGGTSYAESSKPAYHGFVRPCILNPQFPCAECST